MKCCGAFYLRGGTKREFCFSNLEREPQQQGTSKTTAKATTTMVGKGRRVFVIGVGMTKFEKPGKRDWDYPDMAREAVTKALKDAGIRYEEVQQACVGYVYGDSTCGQRALYTLGETGIPIYNVNNNCSTGSTALFMAKQFIEGGNSDCVLALGFEKMERGSLTNKWNDRTNPMDRHFTTMFNTPAGQDLNGPPAAQMFGSAGREHMAKYGTTLDKFAKIAYKNHKHSVNNPYSQFRDEYSLEQIQKAPEVCSPMTKLQCCPTSEGAAAAILASEEFVKKHGLEDQAVEILGNKSLSIGCLFVDETPVVYWCIDVFSYPRPLLRTRPSNSDEPCY